MNASRYTSAEQVRPSCLGVAADFNRDGGVTLTDAVDVLKQVVGLAAPSPSWVLLDQTKLASSMSMETNNTDATKLKAITDRD